MPRLLSSLFMLVIVLGSNFCESCHQKPQPQNKVVFCLFDLSASTEMASARQKYSDSFKRILDKIVEGDVIVADAITDNPLSQSAFPVNEEFPVFKTDTDTI